MIPCPDFYAELKKPHFTWEVTRYDGTKYKAWMTPIEVTWAKQCDGNFNAQFLKADNPKRFV